MKRESNTMKMIVMRAAMMLLLAVLTTATTWAAKMRSWAIWSPTNTTLYFVRDNVDYTKESTYDGYGNIQAWQIADADDMSYPSGAKNARWAKTAAATCTEVEFKSSFSNAKPLSCHGWFKNFKKLTTIKNIVYLRPLNATDMGYMFYNCSALIKLSLNKKFNTAHVTKMSYMFYGCESLTSLDLSSFDTGKVKDMKSMFKGCKQLASLDLSSFDTSKNTTMINMFNGCESLTSLDLSSFSNKKAMKYMTNMFYGCTDLVSIYVDDAKWKKPKNSDSKKMFEGCSSLVGQDGSTVRSKTDGRIAHTGSGGVLKRWTAAGIYAVNVATGIEHGTVEVSQPTANKDDEIHITVTPDAGYQLKHSVTVRKGTEHVEVDDDDDNDYWFTMPAGDVTVSASFELVSPIVPTYTLTGTNVHFQVGGADVTEAAEGATVTVVANDGAMAPVGMQFTVISDDPEDANYNKPVFVSEQVTVANDGTFTMPPAAVSVSREYEPAVYQLTGNNLEFFKEVYDEDYDMTRTYAITEAAYGEKVIVSADPMTFEGGKYHDGNYSSEQVATFNAGDYEGDKWFTMPASDVTVSAVLLNQGTLTINLSSDPTFAITEETARYMTVMEAYITWVDNDSYTFDMNLDDTADFKISGLETENYMATRLAGADFLADNYAMALRTPGNPLPYKDVLFNIGRETTVSNIFLYESEIVPNGYTLDTYNGQTVNATMAERVLYKDGDWNTLCLPFDVTIAGSPLDGTGVEARTLESAAYAGGTLTLNFSEPVTTIKAGKPYIIKWTKPDGYVAFNGNDNAATCSDLCYPVFQNVLLNDTDEPVEIEDIISFTGTYKTLLFQSDDPSVPADDPSMLFLGTNNTLYYPKTGASIGAFRAYFQLEGDIEAGDLPSSVRSFVLNFSDGAECGDAISDGSEGTGICPAATKEIADRTGAWYDLSGRKLQVEPTQKGIYVKNGRKFIVK